MTHTPLLLLRVSAAKPPIAPDHRVSRLPAGAALLAISIASLLACAPTAFAQAVVYSGAGAVNFGSANVCPSGKTAPAPCSQTLTLTYNVTESGALGTPKTLTAGAPDLDYKLASGTTCAGSVTQGNTCKVNVTFAPTAPGARNGAVEIVDTAGNALATTYIYGTAAGPLAGIAPPPLTTLATIPNFIPNSFAVDGSGNVFFGLAPAYPNCADGSVGEMMAVNGSIPANPVIRYRAVPQNPYPQAVAIDGAGNLFIANADDCSGYRANVTELLAAGGYTTVKNISSGYSRLTDLAVDGSGNLFIIDGSLSATAVKELPASTGYATAITLGGGFTFNTPFALALDSGGNLFVADNDYPDGPLGGVVEELSAAGGYNTVKIIHVSTAIYQNPDGVAIDSANNLFVDFSGQIAEYTAVGGVVPVNPTLLNVYNTDILGSLGSAVALDQHGNIFAQTYTYDSESGVFTGFVEELQFFPPPPLNFAAVAVGHTSSDSPKSVRLLNKGNAALDLSALSISPSWDLVAGSGTPADCTASTSLLPVAECNLSISFKPLDAGPIAGAVTIGDNALPGAQAIPLTGAGIAGPQITSLNSTYGAPYSVVILNGYNFGAAQGSSTVTFNGIATPHYHWSNTQVYVTVPPNATTGNLVATVGGVASNAVPFTVVPMPVVTRISPGSGPEGTLVTIVGQNLLDYQNHGAVSFNGKSLPLFSQTSTALQVAVPAGAVTGVFHVVVNDTGIDTKTFTVPTDPLTFTGSGTDFGSVNVCPSGKTAPAPCSKTLTLTYKVNANTTLGTPKALTTGLANLDYTIASGTTCSGAVTAGNACAVNVAFAPIYPGARSGAVEIVDTSGNVLGTTLISGTGVGPLIGFGPPTPITVEAGISNEPNIAIDASGNVFATYGGGIHEFLAVDGTLPANPVVKVLPGIGANALDGQGNLFVNEGSAITERLAADGYKTTRVILNVPTKTLNAGMAVDTYGNVFASDIGGNIWEILAAGGYTASKEFQLGADLPLISAIAADGSGNLYAVDLGGTLVYEAMEADGFATVRAIPITRPANALAYGIAVDAAGNLFVPFYDSIPFKGGIHAAPIAEYFAVNGVVPPNPAFAFFDSGAISLQGIAIDPRGNIFVGGNNLNQYGPLLQELKFSTPPPLAFDTVAVGHTSADSPQSIQVQNRGNADLDLSALSASANWDIVAGSGTPPDCSTNSPLVASGECNLSVSFKPTETGALTGELTVTDNSLNAPGSTQFSALTGTGTASGPPPSVVHNPGLPPGTFLAPR